MYPLKYLSTIVEWKAAEKSEKEHVGKWKCIRRSINSPCYKKTKEEEKLRHTAAVFNMTFILNQRGSHNYGIVQSI